MLSPSYIRILVVSREKMVGLGRLEDLTLYRAAVTARKVLVLTSQTLNTFIRFVSANVHRVKAAQRSFHLATDCDRTRGK